MFSVLMFQSTKYTSLSEPENQAEKHAHNVNLFSSLFVSLGRSLLSLFSMFVCIQYSYVYIHACVDMFCRPYFPVFMCGWLSVVMCTHHMPCAELCFYVNMMSLFSYVE